MRTMSRGYCRPKNAYFVEARIARHRRINAMPPAEREAYLAKAARDERLIDAAKEWGRIILFYWIAFGFIASFF